MYPCSNPELVSAASNGGGLAIMQPVSLTYAHGWELRKGINYIKSMTEKPFGFNALIEKSNKKYIERMSNWIDIALEEGIRFFVTSLGKPDWVCDKVHSLGGVVYHDVTNRHWANKGKDSGVDGLICVNNRAGGHLGDLTKEQMIEELSDMDLPLICAGGVGGEAELNAALKLGYDGVQMGTRFIATDECTTPQDYKDAIVNAKEEDITWTTKLTGVPIAVIETKGSKKHSNWLIRRLLKSRFKHRVRVLITGISFL
jgi:nitronate monooxygenase